MKGKFLLSSYPSEMLDSYIQAHGWHSKQIVKPLTAMKINRRKKIEVLTANYPI